MLFNSYVFVGFFILVYALYLAVQRHHRTQNILLLVASIWFYGYWNWWFLLLILFTCLNDFTAALWIYRARSGWQRDPGAGGSPRHQPLHHWRHADLERRLDAPGIP